MNDSSDALELLESLHQWRCDQAKRQGRKPPKFLAPSCEQLAVITSDLEPSLVVAGAGAGKTGVMAMRVLYAVAVKGVKPEQILGLTFSRKAAAEMNSRFRLQLSELKQSGLLKGATGGQAILAPIDDQQFYIPEVETSTYNAFAAAIIKEFSTRIGIEPSARLVSEGEKMLIMDELIQDFRGTLPDLAITTIRQRALSLAGKLRDHNVSTTELDRYWSEWLHHAEDSSFLPKKLGEMVASIPARRGLIQLVEAYEHYKREHNLLDFSDQLAIARQILERDPQVAEILRQRHQLILLDEFQDTSVGQLEVLGKIFNGCAATAVGDPNQAIYGWRGASSASLSLFATHFGAGRPVPTYHLTKAWRNQERIRLTANHLTGALRAESQRLNVPVHELNSPTDHCHSHALPSGWQCQCLEDTPAAADENNRGQVNFLFPLHEAEQFELLARRIRQWIDNDKERQLNGSQPETYAVLSRSRANLSKAAAALERYQIAFRVVGIGGLLSSPAIADIRAALQCSLDPQSGAAAMRLIANENIHPDDIRALFNLARSVAKERSDEDNRSAMLAEALDYLASHSVGDDELISTAKLSEPAYKRLTRLGRRLQRVRAIIGYPLIHVITGTVKIFDIDIDVQTDPSGSDGLEAIDAFVNLASGYERDFSSNVSSFLEWLDANEESESSLPLSSHEAQPGVVELMTVHQSKGLEWDRVAVVGLVEGRFPKFTTPRKKKTTGDPVPLSADLVTPNGSVTSWLTDMAEIPAPLRQDYATQDLAILPQLPQEFTDATLLISKPDNDFKKQIRNLEANYLKQITLASMMEERRVAYVAMTRPRRELLLTGCWVDDAGSTKLPSRFLLEALGLDFVKPVDIDDVWGDHRDESIPQPVAWEFNDTDPNLRDELPELFPRKLGAVRKRLLNAAERVNEQLVALQRDPAGQSAKVWDEQTVAEELHKLGLEPGEELYDSIQRAITQAREQRERSEPVIEIPLESISTTRISQLLSDPEDFAISIRRPVPSEPKEGTTVGTAFHQWAQQWCSKASAQAGDPPIEYLDGVGRKLLTKFQTVARSLFGDHPQNFIAVEEPFSLNLGQVTVRGQIDAVIAEDNGERIIDWKTGAPITDPNYEFASQYLMQLLIYRQAWAVQRHLPLDKVDACLVFLGGKATREQRVMSIESLAKLLAVDLDILWGQISTGDFINHS